MYEKITDDLDALLEILPPHISEPLCNQQDYSELLEVVIDLGRQPETRYLTREVILSSKEISQEDINYIVSRISAFGDDNRAGIERTLHRISAIRNRKGTIIGLTCRVGRAIFGTITIIEDLIQSGKSILLMGAPGIGKTTMLREVARVLAEKKRDVIVDTSNEIAGDGDIPHPAIGHARRMQVRTPTMQHAVMIEAVENHMPEVIVIDEIGTELEAMAARTIAERGVQLIATAHGNTLNNLIMNPTLADLIGGIQTVTLGDEEAKRRHTQKSILERKAPPTFDIVIEIHSLNNVSVHRDVASVVDNILRGEAISAEVRQMDSTGKLKTEVSSPAITSKRNKSSEKASKKLYPFGLSRNRLEQVIEQMQLPLTMVTDLKEADFLITSKNYYRRKPPTLKYAETANIPIYVIKSNSSHQMEQCFASIYGSDIMSKAMNEAEQAIEQVISKGKAIELSPQNAYIRRMQHQLAEQFDLATRSIGQDPHRRVSVFKNSKR